MENDEKCLSLNAGGSRILCPSLPSSLLFLSLFFSLSTFSILRGVLVFLLAVFLPLDHRAGIARRVPALSRDPERRATPPQPRRSTERDRSKPRSILESTVDLVHR